MHSIELLLDEASDEFVRREWSALAEAGLPSQARHSGETNAPHLTLVARAEIGAEHDDRLRAVAAGLPVGAELGGLVVFGGPPRGLVLARLAVVTRGLLSLHEAVHRAASGGGATDAVHTLPGRWTPHVTLASRLTPGELAAAVEALDAYRRAAAAKPSPRLSGEASTPAPPHASQAVALRRWDSTTRTVTPLGPAL
jgi:2'-5' RNA ligase